MDRTQTRKIFVGNVAIGGGAPITVQSMCNTKTENVEATLAQIDSLEKAGCEIVRLAVPDMSAARALSEICRHTNIPVVADIHFDYKLALASVDAGVAKIRINPGNIGGADKVRAVADACREKKIPIRIGVNTGSIEKTILEKYGRSPKGLCESAIYHVRLLEEVDFSDICISIKSSDVQECFAAYKMMSELCDYPLHLGVTETGTPKMGVIKSAAGIGALLLSGIGDTIRVSLTADPVEEVKAGISILRAVGLRRDGVNIVSCPTCGRTSIDLIATAERVERQLSELKKPITVAVMGCAVNGPGEAREADYGLAGGKGEGIIFKRGEIIKKVPEEELADELVNLILSEM